MKVARNTLLILLAFLGLGAIGGGAVLIISPTGALFGMPLSMLKNSPFHSFLIPGIILFTVLGLVPCLLIIALFKRLKSELAEKFNCYCDMHWAWSSLTSFIAIFPRLTEHLLLGNCPGNTGYWNSQKSHEICVGIVILSLKILDEVKKGVAVGLLWPFKSETAVCRNISSQKHVAGSPSFYLPI